MSIELTTLAAQEVRTLLRENELDETSQCLRVGIKGIGSQRQFVLDLVEPDGRGETMIESQGIRICYSPRDEAQLRGVVIDFRDMGGTRGFTFERPSGDVSRRQRQPAEGQTPPDEPQVRQALREVIDPEVGINIVDLGLVYGIKIDGRNVRVIMTMTTPACPMGEHIRNEVHTQALAQCPGAGQVEVELVWEPPWSSDKISAEGKAALGWSR